MTFPQITNAANQENKQETEHLQKQTNIHKSGADKQEINTFKKPMLKEKGVGVVEFNVPLDTV